MAHTRQLRMMVGTAHTSHHPNTWQVLCCPRREHGATLTAVTLQLQPLHVRVEEPLLCELLQFVQRVAAAAPKPHLSIPIPGPMGTHVTSGVAVSPNSMAASPLGSTGSVVVGFIPELHLDSHAANGGNLSPLAARSGAAAAAERPGETILSLLY